jgi:hypothetical protein
LRELFDRLAYEGYQNRVDVIKYAAEMDGFVSALSVYEICDYDDDRTLRGFTRPVKRITGQLRQLGKISESAVSVLETRYEAGEMKASGFSVDPLLVSLINELADDTED